MQRLYTPIRPTTKKNIQLIQIELIGCLKKNKIYKTVYFNSLIRNNMPAFISAVLFKRIKASSETL